MLSASNHPADQSLLLARLRDEIRRIERRPARRAGALPCGLAAVDALLPGGFPCGALAELRGGPASGKTAVALGTVAGLPLGALAAWVDGRGELYPPAAAALGVDLSRLLIVRPPAGEAGGGLGLWAAEVLLGSGAFAAVALDVPLARGWRGLDASLRRLVTAAEQGGAAGLWLSPERGAVGRRRRSGSRCGASSGAGRGASWRRAPTGPGWQVWRGRRPRRSRRRRGASGVSMRPEAGAGRSDPAAAAGGARDVRGGPAPPHAAGPRVLALHLPGLPLQRLARGREVVEAGSARPIAVVAEGRVVACDAAARSAGVRPGDTQAQALAACGALRAVAHAPAANLAALRGLAEALLALGPAVEVVAPDALLLDASAAHLVGGAVARAGAEPGGGALAAEHRLLARARELVAGLGYAARGAVASGRGPALALARHGAEAAVCVAPGREAQALAPLPLDALGLGASVAERLAGVGVRSVGELARLPAEGLALRFGAAGAAAARLARGDDPTRLIPYLPETLPEESIELEGVAESAEPVLFVLGRLAERVAARLGGRGLGASRLKLTLHLDPRGEERLLVPLARPSAEPARWLPTLRERLLAVRLPGAVTGVKLTAAEVAACPAAQLAFGDRPEVAAALETVLARLGGRLGDAAVLSAEPVDRHRPEAAWRTGPVPAAAGRGWGRAGARRRRRCGRHGGEASEAVAGAGGAFWPTDARPTRLLAAPLPVVATGEGGRVSALRLAGRGPRRPLLRGAGAALRRVVEHPLRPRLLPGPGRGAGRVLDLPGRGRWPALAPRLLRLARLFDRMATPRYAELRCRSCFSFLEGASHPEELVAQAARARALGAGAHRPERPLRRGARPRRGAKRRLSAPGGGRAARSPTSAAAGPAGSRSSPSIARGTPTSAGSSPRPTAARSAGGRGRRGRGRGGQGRGGRVAGAAGEGGVLIPLRTLGDRVRGLFALHAGGDAEEAARLRDLFGRRLALTVSRHHVAGDEARLAAARAIGERLQPPGGGGQRRPHPRCGAARCCRTSSPACGSAPRWRRPGAGSSPTPSGRSRGRRRWRRLWADFPEGLEAAAAIADECRFRLDEIRGEHPLPPVLVRPRPPWRRGGAGRTSSPGQAARAVARAGGRRG